MIITAHVEVSTRGNADMVDLTASIARLVEEHGLQEGQVLVFVSGSTAGITTVEFEPGLQRDLPAAFERLFPTGLGYHHDATWHDGNGHSHVQASFLKPGLTIPVAEGAMLLGTWQQVVLLDFDTRSRQRRVVVQLSGT